MKKYEVQHLITVCENFPVKMSAIVVKNEEYKKEILDMVEGRKCKFIDNEIRFLNGNVIQIIESKDEVVRGKRAKMKPYIDDFEKASYYEEELFNENYNRLTKTIEGLKWIE